VRSTLHFYAPPKDGSKPEFHVTHPSGSGTKNYGHDEVEVMIQDIRGHEAEFSLDQNSFQPVHEPLNIELDFDDPVQVEESYYPAIINLILKQVSGAKEVFIFDHCIRKVTNDRSQQRPVNKVHVDQTPKAALMRYEMHVPEATRKKFEGERIRLINIWRPLKGPVLEYHLAVADSKNMRKKDLIKITHVYPDRIGETYGVKHRDEQKFWYLSGMKVDEVLLLQCFDSRAEGGNCCAHASFRDPSQVG
ncbi:uncharacterized protein LY89DRAFT_758171, partial [Mollisia scopiformis]